MSTLQKICVSAVERANALNYKGAARDRFALDYLLGAHSALTATGQQEDADHIGRVCVMIVSVRGYRAVLEIASEADKAQRAASA